MTTPCHAIDCRRTADIALGQTLLCARHYKREAEWQTADDARKAEIQAEVARLQEGAK